MSIFVLLFTLSLSLRLLALIVRCEKYRERREVLFDASTCREVSMAPLDYL